MHGPGQRIMLLIQADHLFLKMQDFLDSRKRECVDYIFQNDRCPLVFMDYAYYKAGTADYLKVRERIPPRIVLLVSEDEFIHSLMNTPMKKGTVDDVFILREEDGAGEMEGISAMKGNISLDDYVHQALWHSAGERRDKTG